MPPGFNPSMMPPGIAPIQQPVQPQPPTPAVSKK